MRVVKLALLLAVLPVLVWQSTNLGPNTNPFLPQPNQPAPASIHPK
ncbi:MAG: hypothetical protein HOP22_06075 [Nitrospiraceae bacterium]|nr:hypothetical protein [Nitrospiraceae bacterium]